MHFPDRAGEAQPCCIDLEAVSLDVGHQLQACRRIHSGRGRCFELRKGQFAATSLPTIELNAVDGVSGIAVEL